MDDMSVSVKNDDNEALESKIKKEQKQFQEIVDIAGETVYVFLQFERIFIEGWIIAIATVLFQCFFVYFFLAESFQCGLDGGSNCFVNTLTGSSGDPAVTNKTTQVGLVTGCIVAVLFLTPDFMKGIVFLKQKYIIIGVVHIAISLLTLGATMLYILTTAVTDIQILTSIVIILFVVDLDERAFQIQKYSHKLFFNRFYE